MDLDEIKRILTPLFKSNREIIAAYLYGSFLQSENYNDIDIGILVEKRISDPLYESRIARDIEVLLASSFDIDAPIDVRVLNDRPLRFLFSILKQSFLLYCSDESERVTFESKVMTEYLDLRPHHEKYEKMRRMRYASS